MSRVWRTLSELVDKSAYRLVLVSLRFLPCPQLTDRHLVNQTKRSCLLNMPGMKRDLGKLEAWILGYLYRVQFSGIEPALYTIQSASYRVMDS